MKKVISLVIVSVLFMLSTIYVFAKNNTILYQQSETPVYAGNIEQDVYDLLDSYEHGIYKQNVIKSTIDPKILFSRENQLQEDEKYINIYDVKQIDNDTYAATRISLEQESQDSLSGVVMYNRIVYDQMYVGNFPALKLTQIKGGVVRNNGDYWCESLNLRYKVYGNAHTSDGASVGYKGAETGYGSSVYSPNVGSAYVISGPNDYYYNMGFPSSAIVGFTRGLISKRLSTSVYLEISSSISG